MSKDLPSPEMLRKLLRYEPETGKLYWRERNPGMFKGKGAQQRGYCTGWNSVYSCKEAFKSVDKDGYFYGVIFDRAHRSHRVIWAIYNGEWPADQIDHINGVRNDNRIVNLRVVSGTENQMNRRINSNNTSGSSGVRFRNGNRPWIAQIKVGNRCLHLGCFAEKADAVCARVEAERKYGFHENHGKDGRKLR